MECGLFGHGFIARHLFFDDLNHAAFAAGLDGFSDRVVVTGFHLFSFCAITGGSAAKPEHRTARGKAQRNGDQNEEGKEFFHEVDEVGFRLEQTAAGCESKRGDGHKGKGVNTAEHNGSL